MEHRRQRTLIVVVAMCGVTFVTAARAQVRADTAGSAALVGARSSLLRGGAMGELLSVYVPRGAGEIQRLLDEARASQRSAANEIDGVRRLATAAEDRARIMKEELDASQVRLDVAKRGNDAAARAQLTATYTRQLQERDYLLRLREAMRADGDRLEAERTAAAARIRALELEQQVASRSTEFAVTPPTPEQLRQYRALLRQMLDAQVLAAERSQDAMSRRRLVALRRLRQLEALSRLSK